MYDVKEQAKIYLDRIEGCRKLGGPFLLVIIPVIVLLIMGIASNYTIVRSYIATQKYKESISDKEDQYQDTVKKTRLLLSDLKNTRRDSLKTASDSVTFFQILDSVKNSRKNQIANLSRYDHDKLRQNVILQSQIDSLQIPFEIPFLKKTESLSIRTVVVIVMLLITVVLVYLYIIKRKVFSLFRKFADLQTDLSNGDLGNFKDAQLNVPPWFFPVHNNFFLTNNNRFVSDTIGFSPDQLRTYNVVLTVGWLLMLALNFFLANTNWNINYKIYHTHYSPLIVFSLILLTIDVFITYKLISPVFGKRVIQPAPPALSQSRAEFISLSAAALACFVFEPVNNVLYNGKKWFHKPRFRQRNRSDSIEMKEGFYTNVSKSKKYKDRVYYFSSLGGPILKTAPVPGIFIGNLSPLNPSDLQKRKYLSVLQPLDLLRYLRRTNMAAGDVMVFLNNYLEVSTIPLPLEFIDKYSSFYQDSKTATGRSQAVHPRITERITEISTVPSAFLPGKYLKDESSIKDENQRALFLKTKNKLNQQLLKRIEHWKIRLSNLAGTSRSSMSEQFRPNGHTDG